MRKIYWFWNQHYLLSQQRKECAGIFLNTRPMVWCSAIMLATSEKWVYQYTCQMNGAFSLIAQKGVWKCVLLHNGNRYQSIPIGHSTSIISMPEKYHTISLALEKLKYQEHQWVICVDLKMANFLLCQQSGYTKYPCFLCLWDSRAKHEHWSRSEWPLRE